jgi:hypothetical protein
MCTICDLKIEFSVDHPMSLSVAVATRQAMDDGVLPASDGSADPLAGMRLRVEAIAALKAMQQRIEGALDPADLLALPDFFALLIESRTWAFFHPTDTGFDPDCRPEPPRITADDALLRDAIIVTAETVMRQILQGALSFQQALADGLIVVDADPERRDALIRCWSAALPVRGFSRFVCT